MTWIKRIPKENQYESVDMNLTIEQKIAIEKQVNSILVLIKNSEDFRLLEREQLIQLEEQEKVLGAIQKNPV